MRRYRLDSSTKAVQRTGRLCTAWRVSRRFEYFSCNAKDRNPEEEFTFSVDAFEAEIAMSAMYWKFNNYKRRVITDHQL